MNLQDFIKSGKVKRVEVDNSKIKSIKELTEQDLEYLNNQKITTISSRKLIVGYYDSLRSILEAIVLKKGYKIYEHEAYKYLLKEINEESNAEKFDRLRKIRNSINYYGKSISIEEAKEIIGEIKKLIRYFIDKYLGEMIK